MRKTVLASMARAYFVQLSKWVFFRERKELAWKAPAGLFEDRANVSSVLHTIYEKKVWGTGSGGGSSVKRARPYCEYLQRFLRKYKIKSVIDYGCGDWRISKEIDWSNIEYLGVDVVSSLIERNRREYGRQNISFLCADMLDEAVSLPSADLFILKDVLQHLSNANVTKILSVAMNSPYLLITNDFSHKNRDCENGDTRPLDIRQAPFNIKQAKEVLSYQHKKSFLVCSLR